MSTGRDKLSKKQYQKAIEAFKQAIRINPEDVLAFIGLGNAYARNNNNQGAIEACKQAIRINPDSTVGYTALGDVSKILKQYDNAIEAYKQAIHIKPEDGYLHAKMGDAYRSAKKPKDAIEAYKQAIQLDGEYVNAGTHSQLGMTYLEIGDKGSALDEYKILKEKDKEKANVLFNMIYK